MPYGELEVIVVEAKKLEADFLHQVNPYVALSLDRANIKKTHTIQNSGPDASWDKLFSFDIVEGRDDLYLQVFNESVENDILGEATVPLETVYQTGYADQWVHITRPSGKGAGEVRLLMKFRKQGPTSGPAGSTPYPIPEHNNNSYFSHPFVDVDYPRTPSYKDNNNYSSLGPIGGAIPAGYGSGDPPSITLPFGLPHKKSDISPVRQNYSEGMPPPPPPQTPEEKDKKNFMYF
ncbi:C2 domain-containing protein [Gigaspora rosea]|uniref:C2 domain-containing protein n=1 Tax=Gigaspora rosea TaxID=44941 RepID=A0A397UD76_9GLOM|nr:C2 domain-containing protein [Gigaspora rosea]